MFFGTGIVILMLITPAFAFLNLDDKGPRTPRKCGYILINRAEKLHRLGYRVVRSPAGCKNITWPKNYQFKRGPYGTEIWSESGERLVWAVDTKYAPVYDPAPFINKVNRPRTQFSHKSSRKTITREWWADDGVHVTTQEELP